MIYQNYDLAKIRASINAGEAAKVKVQGRYRNCRLINFGKNKHTGKLTMKVEVAYTDMPWSSPFPQIDWYNIEKIANHTRWLASK